MIEWQILYRCFNEFRIRLCPPNNNINLCQTLHRKSLPVIPLSGSGLSAFCLLPSGEMLRLRPTTHWLKRFSDFTRRSANEIALPAVGFSGPLYDSKVHPFPPTFSPKDLLPNWVKQARDSLGEHSCVWGLINIDGGFLDNEALWLRDQYGIELPQMCLVNPVCQEILMEFIREILECGVDGIVIDLTDAYPNSGASGFAGISAHCFCEYCFEGLRLKGFNEPKEAFVGERGLLRLVLRIDSDGTAHIDPPHDWIDNRNSSALITLSLARKFVEGDRALLEADATRLLNYLRARVELTADTIRSIFSAARESHKRSAVILGSSSADLTQMVTLQALDAAKAADEYWLPDAPSRKTAPGEWTAIQFLAARSTYNFNAFFEVLEDANSRIRAGTDRFLQMLLITSRRLIGNALSPGAAYTVEKLNQYDGFVGIPLGQEEHSQIVDRVAREMTGDVLPSELLDKLRISNPDKRI